MKLITQTIIIIFIISSFPGKAQSPYPINIEFNYLNKRTILISGTQFSTNQIAIKSNQGIILIDTGISPEYATIIKDSLTKMFSEEKFSYIINTHHHWDHIQGNQVFSETPIIAHINCEAAMNRQANKIIPVLKKSSIVENSSLPSDSIPPPPPSHILINGDRCFRLTLPTMLFRDYLIIKSGEITLNIIYYGSSHTSNDILVYVPELELLAVGDLFFKKSLPQFSKHNKLEVERWISSLRFVLEEGKSIKYVIPGHEEIFSKKELEQYLDYINTMWEGIKSEVAIDNSLEETKKKFNLVNKFPELIEKDMKSKSGSSVHYGNIETFWNIFYNENHE